MNRGPKLVFMLLCPVLWPCAILCAQSLAGSELHPGSNLHLETEAGQKLTLPATVPAGQVMTVRFEQTRGTIAVQWLAENANPDAALRRTNRGGRLTSIVFHALGFSDRSKESLSGYFLIENTTKKSAEIQVSAGALRAAQASDAAAVEAERDETRALFLGSGHDPVSLKQSITLFQKAEAQWRSTENPVELTRALTLECFTLAFPRNDGAAAVLKLPELIALANKISASDPSEAANAYKTAGFIDAKQARYDDALKQYNEALRLFERTQDVYNRVVILENRAKIERMQGHNELALADVEEAIPLAQKNQDGRGELGLQVERGAIAFAAGQLGKAYAADLVSVDLARKTPDPFLEGLAWSDLGAILTELRDFDQATQAFDHASSIWKSSPNPYGELQTLEDRAELQLAKKDFAAARETFRSGVENARKNSLAREHAYFLHGLAITEMRAGRGAEARTQIHSAIDEAEKIEGTDILSAIHAGAGDIDAAVGRWKEANEEWKQAATFAEKRGDTLDQVIALGGLIRAALHAGELNTASEYCQRSMTALESIRGQIGDSDLRRSFFSSRHALYDVCVQTELRRGNPSDAFTAAERGRARLLQEQAVSAGGIRAISTDSATSVSHWTIAEIQKNLDDHTGLVAYWLGEDRGCLWLITEKHVSVFRLPASSLLKGKIKSYMVSLLQRLSVDPGHTATDRAQRISVGDASALRDGQALEHLLLPVGLPAGVQRLLIVKDGPLFSLSFAALPLANGGFLGRQFQLITEPAAGFAFHPVRPSTFPQIRAVVFSDPAAGSGHAQSAEVRFNSVSESLPFAETETKVIIQSFGLKNTKVFTGSSASRTNALNLDWARYQVAHFATHAVFRNTHPELSGLVLAADENMPGTAVIADRTSILSYADVLRMQAPLDLAVLSACNSNAGKFVPGEGMMGLDNAFLASGSARVIGTLWPVDDEASSVFMGYFYRSLQKTRSPALSLKQAQERMLASPQWNAPYFWGAFTLSGDWHLI
jgi:tetratricopeptide (TPR) repeat protein